MSDGATRTIRVDQLARVEGEGAVTIRMRGEEISSVELRIFEPPRLFEALLRGRAAFEAPDITARVCGICPVAYQMSACYAVEAALGVELPPELGRLRRLLYCGEWIESHVLHMSMLHAPDFLGVDDVVGLAKVCPTEVRTALALKKAGNRIVQFLGGREIHPINVKVGGFHRLPTRRAADELHTELVVARQQALEVAAWVSSFTFPDLFRSDVEHVSLAPADEYPMCRGPLRSTAGLDVEVGRYEEVIVEDQVAHSTALHARIVGRGPFVSGPLARFAQNAHKLRPLARETAERVGLSPDCRNPWKSILARAVEVVQALDEAVSTLETYDPLREASVPCPPREGRGAAITEAPRGILYHRYDVAADGTILAAKIVPPTSQNQRSIELDLAALAPQLVSLPDDAAALLAERAIRNYDPCISCATHFLKLTIDRRP
jgi:coenzyme F420-reducing hydrogenase alpha subunit